MPDDEQSSQSTTPSNGLNPGGLLARARETVPSPDARGWIPPSVDALQRALPQYDIVELAGRGGMGAVYKGWQKSLDRHVAIKVLPADMARVDADFAARFKREAKAMARLSHPNIVTVFDAGETADGLLYFVMDFIEGTDVQQMVTQRGPLPAAEVLPIITKVLDALAYAHGKGIIHRDIKPSNVMVDTEGNVKVADFGLAKITSAESGLITASDVTMGTPDFMAPEALSGAAHIDHRADLYAVGVMLYQMLTGQLPRGRFSPPSQAVPGLDKRLDKVVDRALQPQRDARYSSAVELRTDLNPVFASGVAPASRGKPLLFVAAALVLLAGGAWFVWKKNAAPSVPAEAMTTVPSAALVTAPQWSTFEFAKLTPAEVTRGMTSAELRDGLLHLSKYESWKAPLPNARNVAVRAVFVRGTDATADPRLFARGQPGGNIFVRLYADSLQLCATRDSVDTAFLTAKLPTLLREGDETTVQLVCIGPAFIVSANGQVLARHRDLGYDRAGNAGLRAADGLYRSFDYLNLDGLPEAEAMKLLGLSPEVKTENDPTTFAGHRYQFVSFTGSWTEAKAKAEAMGGSLAVLDAPGELDWAMRTFGPRLGNTYDSFWIGASAASKAAGWKWVNGATATGLPWNSPQPDVGGNSPEQGDFPAYMNIHKGTDGYKLNDSSDTAADRRHWRNEIKGFLVEWDDAPKKP